MIVQIKIKSELIEWVANQTGMDLDEAQDFTEQFAGMLYFTGAFEGIGPSGPTQPRPELHHLPPVVHGGEPAEGLVEGLAPKSKVVASSEGPGPRPEPVLSAVEGFIEGEG